MKPCIALFFSKGSKGFVCLKVRCKMIRLLTNELRINWLESITSQSNNRSLNLVLRLFFYFKGEKMNIEKIRQLNDSFRKSFNGGRVVITPYVESLSSVIDFIVFRVILSAVAVRAINFALGNILSTSPILS